MVSTCSNVFIISSKIKKHVYDSLLKSTQVFVVTSISMDIKQWNLVDVDM